MKDERGWQESRVKREEKVKYYQERFDLLTRHVGDCLNKRYKKLKKDLAKLDIEESRQYLTFQQYCASLEIRLIPLYANYLQEHQGLVDSTLKKIQDLQRLQRDLTIVLENKNCQQPSTGQRAARLSIRIINEEFRPQPGLKKWTWDLEIVEQNGVGVTMNKLHKLGYRGTNKKLDRIITVNFKIKPYGKTIRRGQSLYYGTRKNKTDKGSIHYYYFGEDDNGNPVKVKISITR